MNGSLALFDPTQSGVEFSGFGPTRFAPGPLACQQVALGGDRKETRANIRRTVPSAPGVYGMLDRDDRLVYVGMSINLRSRMVAYFYEQADGVEDKQYRISLEARRLIFEPTGHPLTAGLRELELIRRFGPRFNAKGRAGRSRIGFLYLTTQEAPQFRIAAKPPKGCRASWGPIPWMKGTSRAVEYLNHHFLLRDCPTATPIRFADQLSLFDDPLRAGCLRGQIESCLAPCAGACSRNRYQQQLDAAKSLLDGQDTTTLPAVHASMVAAAEQKRFESAAKLRDTYRGLEMMIGYTRQAREAQAARFVYPLEQGDNSIWKVIADGRVEATILAPQTKDQAEWALKTVEAIYAATSGDSTAAAEDFPFMQILTGWFRRNPAEKRQLLSPNAAAKACRQLLPPRRSPR